MCEELISPTCWPIRLIMVWGAALLVLLFSIWLLIEFCFVNGGILAREISEPLFHVNLHRRLMFARFSRGNITCHRITWPGNSISGPIRLPLLIGVGTGQPRIENLIIKRFWPKLDHVCWPDNWAEPTTAHSHHWSSLCLFCNFHFSNRQ